MEHKITVVGIGPGSPEYLLPVAKKVLDAAKVLVGSGRALKAFAPPGCQTKIIDKDIAGVLAFIRERLAETDVVVMVSGDPGFYSMLTALRNEYLPEIITVIPGISAIQLAFARLALPWQEAQLVSLHGRELGGADVGYYSGRKLAFLTDGQHDPGYIARMLVKTGWPAAAKTILCSNLSYDDEKIVRLTLGEAADSTGFTNCIMVVMA
ncbi:MAG: precorrin-6y C5,15-methyltransferase (decarboxylating), CbiE subunit [Firmicutes bacterium]|nr:precorrin-6y C5,15-methyltransferase (decarboxylating), CbiE subunit [Bacillota bacterium]